MTEGYSGTPLARKLGIKTGHKIKVVNAPEYYFSLFTDMPDGIKLCVDNAPAKDMIHFFATNVADIQKNILPLKNEIKEKGMMWLSLYKKSL